ncbi:hypothetical protein [Sphingomonas mollis]|uniref:CopG family transcriptional regulator n=1 Tax=Sphingomonas mollis TaxID=2795726 RepID=A0ABS0XTC0_9SPHN|nr:hypothetical protein [Sphingomonas sp. BT553]MBJ6123298.1 hypothetical protein [Sphingomonas sp. BT553]
MADVPSFTLPEALRAQQHLRETLGLGEERFPVPAFVNMISDEIEQLRDTGRSDAEIAALIEQASGHELSPDDLARYYTPADERHGHEG